jgi:formiminotetrahydrofolate cyclodeaminase
MELFSPDQILERKMFSVMGQGDQQNFLDALADGTATPGGGSAAAYTGAIAAALVAMVARLTIGKKGYSQVEKDMVKILDEVEELRQHLTKSVDEDSEAFVKVMEAYQMPKSDRGRQEEIQMATLHAAEVPLTVSRKILRVSELGLMVAKLGNKNAITDAGTAVALANAAMSSAGYNVRINLLSLDDKKKTKAMLLEVKSLLSNSQDLLQEIDLVLTERGELP